MNNPKKICFITGTRAEYGLLKPVMSRIKENKKAVLQIIVMGSHLSAEFGFSYQEIEQDGFHIDKKIEMLLSSDSQAGVVKSMGLTMLSLSEALQDLLPDMVVVLGDRYEIFAAVAAAYTMGIPVAHISGGEVTEGALDDGYRHSITKMSHLHFTSNQKYRQRVIQLGEQPETVFDVGDLGVENSLTLHKMSRESLAESLSFDLQEPFLLFTYHPETTMSQEESKQSIETILKSLEYFPQYKVIFTKANADAAGRKINQILGDYVALDPERFCLYDSLGRLRYLSAMSYCEAVVGNSSSGIVEAPAFQVATVNIGNRQKGRMMAESVINCNIEENAIVKAIERAVSLKGSEEWNRIKNPYGNGRQVSEQIERQIMDFLCQVVPRNKKFYDMENQNEK